MVDLNNLEQEGENKAKQYAKQEVDQKLELNNQKDQDTQEQQNQ